MKYLKRLTFIIAIIASTTAAAEQTYADPDGPSGGETQQQPITQPSPQANPGAHSPQDSMIYTLRIYSSRNFVSPLITKDYVGFSDNPCSDLQIYKQGTLKRVMFGENGEQKMSSAGLVNQLGPKATWMKSDMTLSTDKIYTTGNILLKWDDKLNKYTQVTPSYVSVDVSGG
jgi:hypothetical protein